MLLDETHPEDVKAAIRKKYGTIKRFHEANGLPEKGVQDILRGRASRRVADAIERVLSEQLSESTKRDTSRRAA
ncbi:hypothetical protein DBR17_04905 [Sphingomonas sp. HMWF008]|nr:hypothetical protein DBR17_04905 [Sphingomonas sp. HMWF008]